MTRILRARSGEGAVSLSIALLARQLTIYGKHAMGFADRLRDDRAVFILRSTNSGNGSRSHSRHPIPKIWIAYPKTVRKRKHITEQVARVEVSLNEGLEFEMFERDRDEISRTYVLAKHDSQVLDREKTKRYLPQTMTFSYEVRWVIRLAPPFVF